MEDYVICDLCGNIVKLAEAETLAVRQEDATVNLYVCPICLRRERDGAAKYVKKAFKKLEATPPSSRGGVLRLIEALNSLQKALQRPVKKALKAGVGSIPEIRADLITKLVNAVNITYSLAEKAPEQVEKGAAGGTKERYYRVLGYLAQVLDGILKNEVASEVSRLIELAKGEAVHELRGEKTPVGEDPRGEKEG